MIEGLYTIDIDVHHEDRGMIYTLFNKESYSPVFVQDKISRSHKGVMRGFHGDSITGKMVTCLLGSFQFVVIDARKESATRGEIFQTILFGDRPQNVYVPPGCLNCHLVLEEGTTFHYKLTEFYQGVSKQTTMKWTNSAVKDVKWLLPEPYLLSDRDKIDRDFEGIQL